MSAVVLPGQFGHELKVVHDEVLPKHAATADRSTMLIIPASWFMSAVLVTIQNPITHLALSQQGPTAITSMYSEDVRFAALVSCHNNCPLGRVRTVLVMLPTRFPWLSA